VPVPQKGIRFSWPTALVEGQTGALLPETKAFIKSVDPAMVAGQLKQESIGREGAIHTLRRIERLKQDEAATVELQPADINSNGEYRAANAERIGRAITSSDQGLSAAQHQKLNQIVDAVYGKTN
jgi:hypothetical protein